MLRVLQGRDRHLAISSSVTRFSSRLWQATLLLSCLFHFCRLHIFSVSLKAKQLQYFITRISTDRSLKAFCIMQIENSTFWDMYGMSQNHTTMHAGENHSTLITKQTTSQVWQLSNSSTLYNTMMKGSPWHLNFSISLSLGQQKHSSSITCTQKSFKRNTQSFGAWSQSLFPKRHEFYETVLHLLTLCLCEFPLQERLPACTTYHLPGVSDVNILPLSGKELRKGEEAPVGYKVGWAHTAASCHVENAKRQQYWPVVVRHIRQNPTQIHTSAHTCKKTHMISCAKLIISYHSCCGHPIIIGARLTCPSHFSLLQITTYPRMYVATHKCAQNILGKNSSALVSLSRSISVVIVSQAEMWSSMMSRNMDEGTEALFLSLASLEKVAWSIPGGQHEQVEKESEAEKKPSKRTTAREGERKDANGGELLNMKKPQKGIHTTNTSCIIFVNWAQASWRKGGLARRADNKSQWDIKHITNKQINKQLNKQTNKETKALPVLHELCNIWMQLSEIILIRWTKYHNCHTIVLNCSFLPQGSNPFSRHQHIIRPFSWLWQTLIKPWSKLKTWLCFTKFNLSMPMWLSKHVRRPVSQFFRCCF